MDILKKIKWFLISSNIAFLLFNAQTVKANSLIGPSKNYSLEFFIIVNIFQSTLIFLYLNEIKKRSPSDIWNIFGIASFINVLYAFSVALIVYKLVTISSPNLAIYGVMIFYTIGTFTALLGIYLLVKPLIREKIDIMHRKYSPTYIASLMFSYFLIKLIPIINIPSFPKISLLIIYAFLYAVFVIYIGYVLYVISASYKKIGFVRDPYLGAFFGTLSMILTFFLIIYVSLNYISVMYYYLIFCFTAAAFAFMYYFVFIIDYPSLLERKWKALMPFNVVNVATSITLAFLAASLFFTVKESPNFALYQNVTYNFLIIALFAIFTVVALILSYIKIITQNSKLRFWSYLKAGLFVHLAATFYVFSLTAILWDEMTFQIRVITSIFWLLAFLFYLFYVLDLRTVIKDLDISISYNRLDIGRYFILLYSAFFLVFLGISFTHGKDTALGTSLESSPVILFFIAAFLLAFATYLSVTHKGLEELLKINVWSELSYMASFGAFVVVYFFYRSIDVQRFPLRDLFFIGYFATLVIEIASIRTLGVESKYRKRKETIQDLLNYHTGAWLRADYLGQLWERIVTNYEALSEELARVRFNPAIRGFHLGRLDEDARITVAAAMLLEMYKLEDLQRITITGATSESIKDEIEEVLKDKILLLPEGLRAQFREEKYYPRLFEKCINDLMEKVKTFVPQKEHEAIQRKLASSDEFFNGISFGDKVVVQAPQISREEFLRNFKKYIGALEVEFPFQYTLLHDAVKEEIADVLSHYGFTVEEILDLVPTGLAPMDDATDGGLVKRTSTLLVAEETKKKNEILISFALQGLKDKDCVVYVTSKRSSEEILDLIALEDLTRLTIIDLYRDIYTPNSVKAILEEGNVTFIPPSATLFQHSIVEAIKRYPREAHKRIILDAYVDLLKYYGWGKLFEILQKQLSGLRKWNCTVIVTIDQDLVPPLELEEIKKRFDNIIVLSGKGKQALATLQKLHGGTPRKGVIPL